MYDYMPTPNALPRTVHLRMDVRAFYTRGKNKGTATDIVTIHNPITNETFAWSGDLSQYDGITHTGEWEYWPAESRPEETYARLLQWGGVERKHTIPATRSAQGDIDWDPGDVVRLYRDAK